jgi:hypothetical protein
VSLSPSAPPIKNALDIPTFFSPISLPYGVAGKWRIHVLSLSIVFHGAALSIRRAKRARVALRAKDCEARRAGIWFQKTINR